MLYFLSQKHILIFFDPLFASSESFDLLCTRIIIALRNFDRVDQVLKDDLKSIELHNMYKMRINLAVEDFVEMSREEMIEYYGVDYFPVVPADMKAWEGGKLGIFKRNGGTGEVYRDQDVLNYSNEDITRHINIEVAKGNIPFLDYRMFSADDEISVINNVELKIGLTDDGHYFTEFMYKNVGFIISTEGLTQDEFVSVISSIIK